jgi:hypothetical protein
VPPFAGQGTALTLFANTFIVLPLFNLFAISGVYFSSSRLQGPQRNGFLITLKKNLTKVDLRHGKIVVKVGSMK